MAIRIDVVVVVIDRGIENTVFNPFLGMLVGSCYNTRRGLFKAITEKM